MEDPIGSFYDIRNNLILYIKTAFSTKYPSIENDHEKCLKEDGNLCKAPWIEPIPRYKAAKKITEITLSDLELNGRLPNRFSEDDLKRLHVVALEIGRAHV